jgi:pentatricopeptide repeat protein
MELPVIQNANINNINGMNKIRQKSVSNNKTLPEVSTYRIVIECCIISNQADVAVQLLQSCVQYGMVPSTHTFEIIISVLAKKLQWRRSIQLLDIMDQFNVSKTVQLYNAIISSCSKAKESIQARNLLSRMTTKDKIRPNIVSYNSVISACASNNDWKNALAVFDLVHREPGVTPDVYTYTKYVKKISIVFIRCMSNHLKTHFLFLTSNSK